MKYDAQTSNLDQANTRSADLVQLADGCQARQQALLTALNPPPWWQAWIARLTQPAAAAAPARATVRTEAK